MKVLHILNSHIYSGAENVACSIIENMPKQYECWYMSPRGSIEEHLREKGVQYIGVDKLSVGSIRMVIQELHPDLVHAHDFTASVLSAVACKKNISLISHIHCNPDWLGSINKNTLAYQAVVHRFSHIVCVSDSFIEQYHWGKSIANKTEVIGNPFSVEKIRANLVEARETRKYDVGFVGRLEEEKQPIKYISLMSELKKQYPELKGIMVGAGSMEKECKKALRDFQLEETIDMLGFQKNPYSYMAQTKIMCITSKWEGFGLVALEAMALGCPVIATRVGGLTQIVTDNCGRLCEETTEFIEELGKLLTDKAYYQNKSEGAVQRAYNYDNMTDYIQKIEEIYMK